MKASSTKRDVSTTSKLHKQSLKPDVEMSSTAGLRGFREICFVFCVSLYLSETCETQHQSHKKERVRTGFKDKYYEMRNPLTTLTKAFGLRCFVTMDACYTLVALVISFQFK